MKKIIDTPKFKKQLNEINKTNNKKLTLEQKKLKQKYKDFLMLPDKFNGYFSQKCWIAHDYFNDKIMIEAINIYEKNKNMQDAENFLTDIYDEAFLNKLISSVTCFKNCYLENLPNIGTLFIKYFLDRIEIIEIAKQDYLNEKYYSSIPLLLSVIDGITNDIDHAFGFFTSNVDLILEDSIVGHESGLQTIQKIVNQSKKVTNNEPITIPYRNGILHGRNINYGSKIVAAKCWHILFALKDWAKDNNRENFTVENREPITKEEIHKIVPQDFDEVIKALFEKLKNGRNNELIYFGKYPTNIYSKFYRMSELSRLFKDIKFMNFEIVSKEEFQDNSKSINIQVYYKYLNKSYIKQVNFLFEYSTFENKLISIKNSNGSWKFDFLQTFCNLKETISK
ncbi:MAG: hypothetical protein Q8N78_04885 [Sulfurimonas sp.]|nr:hypothetical protein [Sulfurimonas sp.]